MIRVLLVDDHRLVRAGLTSLLESTSDVTVVGEAADGAAAVELAAKTEIDVILMDLSMPVLDGVEATRRILLAKPETRVVVLSSFSEQSRVREAIAAGATGYVLKDCSPDELLAAVRSAAAGHAPLDPRVACCQPPSHRTCSPTARPKCCAWPARAWRTSRLPERWGSPSARSRCT
jgi:DNA-binding NarL/FixJ family response regulator